MQRQTAKKFRNTELTLIKCNWMQKKIHKHAQHCWQQRFQNVGQLRVQVTINKRHALTTKYHVFLGGCFRFQD